MRFNKFNEFKITENLDKDALEEILREWGVFNPSLFFNWLEENGYTIVELDPVGSGIVESFNSFELDEWDYELDELIKYLDDNNIDDGILDKMHKTLGYIIIKENDIVDAIKKKFKLTIPEKISKLKNYMMDAEYNGLRALIVGKEGNDKEQYDHIMEYVYKNIKLIKGILKLENNIEKLKKDSKISSTDLKEFNDFVLSALSEIHYRYPWKFKGYLSEFDQDDMNAMIDEYNKLVSRYGGKQIYIDKNKK